MKTLFFYLIFFCSVAKISFSQKLNYPVTKKVNQVDNYFGTMVEDPYRWLEDDRALEVEEWVKKQNDLTFSYLSKIPFRNQIKKRMEEVINYPRYSAPFKEGDYYYFYKNDGLQNQSVLYRQKGLNGEPEIFIDPNKFSVDGTIKLGSVDFSKDGKYLAYSISRSGSDWREIFVMDVQTKKKLSDSLAWAKFTGAVWFKDGFYYSRYDEPKKGEKAYSEKNTFHKVYYHRVGDEQKNDKLIFQDTTKILFHTVAISEDEKYLYLFKSGGGRGNSLYFKEVAKEGYDFIPIIETMDDDISPVDNIDDKLIAYTTIDAPNGRVILIDLKKPTKCDWKELIPEKDFVLQSVSSAGGKLFLTYLKDVSTKAYVYNYDGKLENEITFPTFGSAGGFGGKKEDKEVFYTFTSFTYPPTIFKYDVKEKKSELFRKTEISFNPDEYEVKQVFYPSKDGTKIPMYIIHKKGIKLNGNNPTLLYGYGGFNISLTPSFDAFKITWLEQGYVYAQPNLRGGGEYGEKWHQAGTKLNKQNVFDDFISAAEYLIKEKYTSTPKLAIHGGSNGGLLVGACMTQRPDLFGVCIPEVGVMDMLRYHTFTIGWNWASDYGRSDDSTQFKNLYSYSPLHNIKAGVKYPPTLITTADHDDRVVPAHSFKFAATLQEKNSGDSPSLIRIETKSGHGASSTTKRIEILSDIYSFILFNMNESPKL